ncbi:hypothetical protein BATDEDRAFT_92606 [Batrachochytrium dendrobatidis JAM81]|uniref:EF-hand domain-containing protein n=1 Tax=Batrachochytrium dendrobatidis (strain JAM81 / FGSC 10211) TaxID=684364 RepID=F4PE62_BATDJ|nr:uncharacterized protein BATDEDRAFT_92606 [Batrachochytrium dendrobatidis JAM81]EGF76597.1 hypothetical protein BATDEDRAFT_92606 [Batrachochytrium dendrobatidis JAM81]|eukprot:XP_006682925.1 hypothetical protein BATDEDRAFT_92606 [Batrachochytrium dendrobatidis JAM81]
MSDTQRSTVQDTEASNFACVQQKMNIHHFEQLMDIFHSHQSDDGSTGFTIDKVCRPFNFDTVFKDVFGENISHEQMKQLFMKIDANSDETVTWDDFSAYMMTVSIETDDLRDILDERNRKIVTMPHKDMVIRIEYVSRERKYLSVSRDGVVCLWSRALKLNRSINTKELYSKTSWTQDARFMHKHNKLIIISNDRQLCIYDIFSIKPRLVTTITQLEHNPLCVAFSANYDEKTDLILFGDDGGYINVLSINDRFLLDATSDGITGENLTPSKLSKKDSLEKHNISLYRRKIHDDWVLQVQYYPEMNAFVSCAVENSKSLVIGDLERKTLRYISVPKGIRCFEFCRRPSFLVTGGRDKIIRLWNPYVLSKPAGSLHGHNAGIFSIVINHENGHIISLSEDKVVKIWNARHLNCLQTIVDKNSHRPENTISSIYFDAQFRQIITGSDVMETWPLHTNSKQIAIKSHDSPVVSAMFNSNFNQVVSGCQTGTIIIWDPLSGEKIFQFHNAHGTSEITAMCFDKSGRRLITGGRDCMIKMWNFNNGQTLRHLIKNTAMETTEGLNRFIVAVGWDRTISIFIDNPSHFDARPTRVLNGSGSGAHKGHEDDISAVAFCPPNMLATSSVDGTIVIWNLESGYIKVTMKEPFLNLRSKEEKPVEKFNCQTTDDEGLTTMSSDDECTMLFIGGSKGHIRIVDLKALLQDVGDCHGNLVITQLWRAHMQSVSSVSYIKTIQAILTSSKDYTVRIWNMEGLYIGTFGDRSWVFDDISTYSNLPLDLKQDRDLEMKQADISNKKEALIKKNIISTWRSAFTIAQNIECESEGLYLDEGASKSLKKLKEKAVLAHITKKWKEYWLKRKNIDDWTLSPDLITVKNSKSFFSYGAQNLPKISKPSTAVKYDSVYHMLQIHPMEDLQSTMSNPLKMTKISRVQSFMK